MRIASGKLAKLMTNNQIALVGYNRTVRKAQNEWVTLRAQYFLEADAGFASKWRTVDGEQRMIVISGYAARLHHVFAKHSSRRTIRAK